MNKPSALAAVAAAAFFTILATPPASAANSPVGYWTATAWDDTSPNMVGPATQHICFYANGTWKGTFPAWRGQWFQKGTTGGANGDRVRIVGNWANGGGNDGAEIDFVNLRLMTGTWTEWFDVPPGFGTFVLWLRVNLAYAGPRCPVMPPAQAPAAASRSPFSVPSK